MPEVVTMIPVMLTLIKADVRPLWRTNVSLRVGKCPTGDGAHLPVRRHKNACYLAPAFRLPEVRATMALHEHHTQLL